MKILITNNPMANQKHFDATEKIFLEAAGVLNVLYLVRDKIHEGHKLLTHPLSGSVKPNQTPYKSIMITKGKGQLDFESLRLIEDSIAVAKSLENSMPPAKTPEGGRMPAQAFLEDFQLIDLSLIESGLTIG